MRAALPVGSKTRRDSRLMPQFTVNLSRIAALVAALATLDGCSHADPVRRTSLFKQPTMSPDSVVLELFFVRFPYGDEEINGPMWEEIDEQRLSNSLRANLAKNGFRAGVVSGAVPAALRRRLDDEPDVEQPEYGVAVELEREPSLVRRRWQIRAAERRPILASGIYEKLPLLYASHGADGGVGGRPYERAQCLFSAKAFPQGAGRARLEILPEVEFGDPKNNWVASDTSFRLEPRRESIGFDDLRINTLLESGEMLVIGCLPNRSGSLGHFFCSDEISDSLQQKLVILRLAQTQYDDTFALTETAAPSSR